jgi:hypothetical protein
MLSLPYTKRKNKTQQISKSCGRKNFSKTLIKLPEFKESCGKFLAVSVNQMKPSLKKKLFLGRRD